MAVILGAYKQITSSNEVLNCTVVEIIPGQDEAHHSTVIYKIGDSKFSMTQSEHDFENKWVKI